MTDGPGHVDQFMLLASFVGCFCIIAGHFLFSHSLLLLNIERHDMGSFRAANVDILLHKNCIIEPRRFNRLRGYSLCYRRMFHI